MSRFAYFFRETLISLRRNLLMTLAGIMTVAISLFLFGGIVLLNRMVDHGTAKWKNGVQLEVFMRNTATQGQIDDMRQTLANTPTVKSFRFLDHNAAYTEFKRIFRDNPALVRNIAPGDLPTSYRVAPRRAQDTENLAVQFHARSGVDTVITAEREVRNMLTATRVIRYVFFTMAGVLLASSLFLIVNTIRLATFARRREIEVMKLVGASNWFVRVPFMAEGLVQGAIGAGISFGLVIVLKNVLTSLQTHKSVQGLFNGFYVTNGDALTIGFMVLLIGAGIGVLGSTIGLRRFLDT
ncbi:MAG: cell division protein [Actinomycetia bacterium]|nr:cell division protein [Actinomycetes bacterium]